jgi:hypothetical protein
MTDKKKEKDDLEEILEAAGSEKRKEVEKDVDKYLKLSSPESIVEMQEFKFGPLKTGTREFFQGVYNRVKKYVTENKLVGKQDEESINKILEEYVLTALQELGHVEKSAVLMYKKRAQAGELGAADKRSMELLKMANEYMGIGQGEWFRLVNNLRSGNITQFYSGLKQFTDDAAEGTVEALVKKEREFLESKHGKYNVNAHIFKYMKDRHGYRIRPKELLHKLDREPFLNIQTYHQAGELKKKTSEGAIGVEEEKKEPTYK